MPGLQVSDKVIRFGEQPVPAGLCGLEHFSFAVNRIFGGESLGVKPAARGRIY